MRLGLILGYWGLGLSAGDQLAMAREAERIGYDSIWVGEAYGSDAATVLAWLAAQTETIGIGAGVFQMPGRSATMTAMTAATLDVLSAGRMQIRIGPSGPQVSEGWHGVRFAGQLRRTREYVEVVRMALEREHVRYDGETISLPLPDGPGRALKLTIAPEQPRIPIYLAAMGPRNVALCGEIADGWIPTLFSPEHVDELRAPLVEGAARAGRTLDDFDVAPMVNVLVSDDIESARDAMRPFLSLYIGGMGSRERNFYVDLVSRYGFEAEARRVQELYLEGRRDEAAAALPDALIDAVTIAGPPDVVRERLAAFRTAGVDTVLCSALADLPLEEKLRRLRLVAELVEGPDPG
jgi:F420-dependent oxidoreductase-like protein